MSDKNFTEKDAKRIQSGVDKLPNPTLKQKHLKQTAQRKADKQTLKGES